jgi:arabinogalactan endo-1,4-beta-galactosidase
MTKADLKKVFVDLEPTQTMDEFLASIDTPQVVEPAKEVVKAVRPETIEVKLLLKRPIEGAFVAYRVGDVKDVRFIPHEQRYYRASAFEYDKRAWGEAAKVSNNAMVDEAIRLLKGQEK